MKYHYVLTLQLRGFDPITYKGTCVPESMTASELLDFVIGQFLKELGRPDEQQYAIIFWSLEPDTLG